MATTQTFDPKYVSGYGDLLKTTTDPNLLSKLTKYGQVTDVYGNPLFDQNVYTAVNSPNTQISNAASKAIDSTLSTWADDVLQKDTLDPLTGKPINWELSGGIGGAQYKAARTNLMANPTNNVRWTAQKTQAQTIADNAVAAAKTVADAKIANDLKIKADADAAATNVANEKATQDAATAAAIEQGTYRQSQLDIAGGMLSGKDLGVLDPATGKPVVQTADITDTFRTDALKGIPTGVTTDATGKVIGSAIGAPIYDTIDNTKLGQISADTTTPTTIDKAGTTALDAVNQVVTATKAQDIQVTPESLVSNRISGLLAKNNPYIQQAVNAANLQASRRGMLNTGAAAGFATDAAIKNAVEIAKYDAAVYAEAQKANAAAANQLLNTGMGLRANAAVSDAGNNVDLATTQAKLNLSNNQFDITNGLTADTFNATALNEMLKFNTTAKNKAVEDGFTALTQIYRDGNLAKSQVWSNIVTAQMDSLKQGASDANAINKMLATGNIELATMAAKNIYDELSKDKTFENDKVIKVLASTLAKDEIRLSGSIDFDKQVMTAKLQDLVDTKKMTLEYANQLTTQYNDLFKAITLSPDITKDSKATTMNTFGGIQSGQMVNINDMLNQLNQNFATQLNVYSSPVLPTITKLVSP
jgi:hypothetical protein